MIIIIILTALFSLSVVCYYLIVDRVIKSSQSFNKIHITY
jgi:hypothetical protein